MITGFVERQAIYIGEEHDGALVPAGTVKFGLAGRGLWRRLDRLRSGLPARKGYTPVRPELVAEVKFFLITDYSQLPFLWYETGTHGCFWGLSDGAQQGPVSEGPQ